MEAIQIPSPSAFLNSPVLQPNAMSNQPRSSMPSLPAAAKTSSSHETVKSNGAAKPKQSKSRNGCVTCKSKRLKCDETKPSCNQCHKRNVECGGYKKDFKWRPFEESSFVQKQPSAPSKSKRGSTNDSIQEQKANPPPAPAVISMTSTLKLERGLASPALSDVSVSTVSHESSLNQSPLPSMMPPQQNGFMRSQNLFSSDPSPYMLPQEIPRMMPRSHPELFHSSSVDSTGSVFDDAATSHSYESAATTASFPARLSSTPNILLSGSEIRMRSSGVADFRILNVEDSEKPHEMSSVPEIQIESIKAEPEIMSAKQLMRLPSPSLSSSSGSSDGARPDYSVFQLLTQVQPPLGSPEMLSQRFDRQTCGILSVKDGPTENPWRTLIWPMVQDSPALYHAVASMTAFHTAKEIPAMRVHGIQHMKKSIKALRNGIGRMDSDAALATTLVLAFSESWDVHISTGIKHLKGAKALVNQALAKNNSGSLSHDNLNRMRFLINTWVYMDVIARLTSTDCDESNDFDTVLAPTAGPYGHMAEIDPLMGCASSLFPMIGRVANLVRKVRRSERNNATMISRALELKEQIENWQIEIMFETPEDASSEVLHSIHTAEAYRWATLLYLHQAVPEIPSMTSGSIARKVMNYLALVPLSSRAIIVHIYPLLAAGCEANTVDDREWVDDRWKAMISRMGIGNIDRCREVVREVWDRRDRYEASKLSLQTPQTFISTPASHSEETSPTDGPLKRKWSAGHSDSEDFPDWNSLAPNAFGSNKRQMTDSGFASPLYLRNKSTEDYTDDTMDFAQTVRGKVHWVAVMQDWNWEVLLG